MNKIIWLITILGATPALTLALLVLVTKLRVEKDTETGPTILGGLWFRSNWGPGFSLSISLYPALCVVIGALVLIVGTFFLVRSAPQ